MRDPMGPERQAGGGGPPAGLGPLGLRKRERVQKQFEDTRRDGTNAPLPAGNLDRRGADAPGNHPLREPSRPSEVKKRRMSHGVTFAIGDTVGKSCQEVERVTLVIMAILDDLKAARRAAGVTQAQMADHLGLARSTITKFERGERFISLAEAVAWAERCGVKLLVATPVGEAGSEHPLVRQLASCIERLSPDNLASLEALLAAWGKSSRSPTDDQDRQESVNEVRRTG